MSELAWTLVLAVGVLPVLLLLRSRYVLDKSRRSLRSGEGLALAVLAVACVHILIAVTGGSGTARLAYPSGVFFIPLVVAVVVGEKLRFPFAVVVVSTLLIWQPFLVLRGGGPAFNRYYTHGTTPRTTDAMIFVVTLVLLVLWAGFAPQTREPG